MPAVVHVRAEGEHAIYYMMILLVLLFLCIVSEDGSNKVLRLMIKGEVVVGGECTTHRFVVFVQTSSKFENVVPCMVQIVRL